MKLLEQGFNFRNGGFEIYVVSQHRAHISPQSGLFMVDLPRMKIYYDWFLVLLIDSSHGSSRQAEGVESQISPPGKRYVLVQQSERGRGKFHDRTTFPADSMGEALCPRESISVMVNGEYA